MELSRATHVVPSSGHDEDLTIIRITFGSVVCDRSHLKESEEYVYSAQYFLASETGIIILGKYTERTRGEAVDVSLNFDLLNNEFGERRVCS